MNNKEFIRLKLISEWTSLSTRCLRKKIKDKELKAIKIGNNYYVTPTDYTNFLINIYFKGSGVSDEEKYVALSEVKKMQEQEKNEKKNKEKEKMLNIMNMMNNNNLSEEERLRTILDTML